MIKPFQRGARCEQGGFALLVVFLMAAMVAITLYLEIPRVAFESQRNREQMLVERGEQYKRAVELYYRKTKTYPQKIEDLENTNNFRFLRKRYKDPLTGKDEWRLVHMGPAGLTDSLVEKMPGQDGDKKGDKKEMTSAATDPSQQVKGPDDITAGSNRTERDQRALMAQRGAGGAGGFGGGDPNAPQQQPEDPNLAFQQQQLREFQQQQLQQQQQQQLQAGQTPPPGGLPIDATSAQNPGAPPMAQMQGNGAPPPGQFPFGQQQQQQQQNPFGQQQQPFPPVGSPNGPVRTLYQPGQLPFNPGNAMLRGAIPNPGGNVSNSQSGGFGQPYNQQQSAFGGASSGFGGGGNSAFNVPQAVRDQLTRPQGRPQQMGAGQQQFGGTGIAGVASNAGGSGIKRYNEKSKYKEWEFVFDYRKPAKGAQKGVTGVGGLKTTDGNSQQQPGSGFGNNNSSGFGNNNNSGFGSGFGGSGSSSGFGSNPRRP